MGWCRVCANTPFGTIFGDNGSSESEVEGEVVGANQQGTSPPPPLEHDDSGYDPLRFQSRTESETERTLTLWKNYVHPRVEAVWGNRSESRIRHVLSQVLTSVDARDDPVTGLVAPCCFWHGEFDPTCGVAVLYVPHTEGDAPKATYVTRALAFLFADTESFEIMARNTSNGLLDMTCDNPKCVNMKHIIIPD